MTIRADYYCRILANVVVWCSQPWSSMIRDELGFLTSCSACWLVLCRHEDICSIQFFVCLLAPVDVRQWTAFFKIKLNVFFCTLIQYRSDKCISVMDAFFMIRINAFWVDQTVISAKKASLLERSCTFRVPRRHLQSTVLQPGGFSSTSTTLPTST